MTEKNTSTAAAKPPEKTPKPSFGERMNAAFLGFARFLGRLLLVLLVLGLIAGAAYLAVPYVYKHYVQPLQDVQTQLDALQQESATRAEQVNQRLAALQDDLAALQGQQKALAQQIDAQQSQWEAVQERLDALEQQNEALEARLDGLEDKVAASQDDVAAVQATTEALQQAWASWEPQIEDTQRQMAVLRAMNSLLRARLLIGQTNYGLAGEELQRAQTIIDWLQTTAADTDEEKISQAAAQVRLAGTSLPDMPRAALQNVETAWSLLNDLLPDLTIEADAAPAEEAPTATPTPTPNP